MARRRTDREIAERLHQLLNQQADLEGQLSGLGERLRAEVQVLEGTHDNERTEAGRRIDLDQVLELLGRLAVAPTEADAVEVIVSAARQLLPDTRGALCIHSSSGTEMAAVGVWDAEEQWNRPYRPGDNAVASPPKRLMGRNASGPTGRAETFPARGFGLELGELRVWAEGTEDALSPEELQGRGELLARSAGLVLAGMQLQENLRHHTVRDPLTGLFNQRYLLDTLAREIHQSLRTHQPMGLLMFDIDRFGPFNDEYGHECGDRMLQAISRHLLANFRESDVACRYSGERFALLLPRADKAATTRRGETVREAIEGLEIGGGRVTISAGVAACPADADCSDTLLAAAESGILLARQYGGNCVLAAERG